MAKRNVVDFKIINLSEEKFQELKEAGQIDPNALYATPDTTKERLDSLESRATSLEETKANDGDVVHNRTGGTYSTPHVAKRDVDNDRLAIYGGTDSSSSYIRLSGKNEENGFGKIIIHSGNDSSSAELILYPDGPLKLKGQDVLTNSADNKKTIVGWGMPNYGAAVKISSGWVAPYDCIGYAQKVKHNNNIGWVRVNGTIVFYAEGTEYAETIGAQWLVPKGATVTFSGTFDDILVFPLKGAN